MYFNKYIKYKNKYIISLNNIKNGGGDTKDNIVCHYYYDFEDIQILIPIIEDNSCKFTLGNNSLLDIIYLHFL